MNRFDFLKALGLSGASLMVADKLNIGENFTEEEQDKFIKLKNEIVELIKTNKTTVEFSKGGLDFTNISKDEISDNEYQTENGYVFSPKGIVYNMRNHIEYNIMGKNRERSKLGWWHKNKIDETLRNEIITISNECLIYYRDFKWFRWNIDDLTFTIARCHLLLKNFEEAKIWYGKCTKGMGMWESQLEKIKEDYGLFKMEIPNDILFTHENDDLHIQHKPLEIRFTNNNDKIIEGITKYKQLLKEQV